MTDSLSSPAPRPAVVAWLVAATNAQRGMWAEAGSVWLRRPLPSARLARTLGDGERFAARRGSWMSVLVPMVVFAQFVDVLLAQGAIHVSAAPAHRVALHVLLALVSLWSVAWAVALRSATRHVDHVLGPQALVLAVGLVHRCRLPLAAIAGVRRIDARAGKDWHATAGLRRRDVTLLSPLDPPTLLIDLHAPAPGAWWTRHGVPRPLRRHVAVYVDQPDAMRAALLAAVAGAAPSEPQPPVQQ